MTDIAVAVVSFNTKDYLDACLGSVLADGATEVVVADNGSSDGSVEMVRASYPDVRLLANDENLGFGKAANRALATCRAPYVLLLNADTAVHKGALSALSTYLDRHPTAGIAAPRLVNVDGSLQSSCCPMPTPFQTFLELSSAASILRFMPWVSDRYLPAWNHNHARMVPWVTGSALAIRKTAFATVGGFDESIFMYTEEIDLCFRMHAQQYQTHFTPTATVTHSGGASTCQNRVNSAVMALMGSIAFYKRHFSRWQLLQLKLVMTSCMLAKQARDRCRLLYAHEPKCRKRLIEDLSVWHAVLNNLWRQSAP